MATVTKPIALDESLNTTEATPRNIADVLAKGIGDLIHAVSQIAPQTVYDLDDLGDVDITSPSNGQVLKYNGTSQKWENGTGGGSGDSVSWSQIVQTGTKIAEIEINGQTTDVYAPTGGGGFSALIVITAATGQTVTVSKGGDTYTAVETSSGTYEVSVDSMGTWTVTDGTNTDTVTVSQQTTYYVTLSSVPDGKTVLPTDDVSIWLACGGRSEAYTTLSEVLNDSVCLSSLIADSNAVDYLVRSKSFAKSEALVPTMTSDTTPLGECFSDTPLSGYPAFQAFDRDGSTQWCASSTTTSGGSYIGYDFVNPTKCFNVDVLCASLGNSVRVEASDDKSTWTTVSQTVTVPYNEVYSIPLTPTKAYRYYRVYKTSSSQSNKLAFFTVQFYTEEGLCDNQTAMSYIGLNNYASNTLLADATWRTAICNSTYFESVLNVKVPVMTSNTTPSGVASSSSVYTSGYEAYKAFDNDNSTSTAFQNTDTSRYVQYDFGRTVRIFCVGLKPKQVSQGITVKDFKVKASSDNITFTEVYSGTHGNNNNLEKYSITTNNNYRSYRLSVDNSYASLSFYNIETLQFYGRADI